MWGWSPEAIRNAVAANATPATQEALEKARLKQEALKKIEDVGEAVCLHCGEDIRKNASMPGCPWESEFLLAWCYKAKGNKHEPRTGLEE